MGAVVNGGCREWSLLWVESVVGGVSCVCMGLLQSTHIRRMLHAT